MKIAHLFELFTRLLPLWVVVCGIGAYLKPALFIPLKPYREIAFARTMLGIGLVINNDEFYPLLRKPQMVFLGVFAQFTIMPALTYLYAHTVVNIPFWPLFMSIVTMVVLPLIAGFILKRFFHNQISKIEVLFPALSTIFIALICGLVVALNHETLIAAGLILFSAVVLHNLAVIGRGRS